MPTTFPSSASKGHPLSPVRATPEEEPPPPTTDRPRPTFRERPAKDDLFLKTGMSSTVTPARLAPIGLLRPLLRASVSRSRRPHFVPRVGTVFRMGVARATARSPAIRGLREASAFFVRWECRARD
jgi:hypothetical protein